MKKEVRHDDQDISSEFDGSIDEVIEKLQQLKERGVTRIEHSYAGYNCPTEWFAMRLETDEEEAEREEREAEEKARWDAEAAEKKRKREERERKDYERLKAKFDK